MISLLLKIPKSIICKIHLLSLRNRLYHLGESTQLPLSTKIEFPQNIYIGDNVSLGRMSWLAANPLTGLSCSLKIGKGSYIGNFAHIYATQKIEIGNDVLMADKVYISDNLHSFDKINIAIINQPIKQLKEVYIGDGSWIGENVCIIGASVGKQSVIGANSVVSKDIPDFCVAVGAPAKIIKRYSFEKQAWLRTDAQGEFL